MVRSGDGCHVGRDGQSAGRVGALHLEDRLRGVLVAEHDVFERILLQVAVDFLQFAERLEGVVPAVVPLRELGNHHPAHRGAHAVVRDLRRTHLVHRGHVTLQFVDQVVAGLLCRHAAHVGDLLHHLLVGDLLGVEGHVAEDAGQQPVVERADDHAFGQQRQLVGFRRLLDVVQGRTFDGGDGRVAVHDALVALGPYLLAVERLRGGYVELGVLGPRSDVHQVGDAFGHNQETVVVDAVDRYVAGVQARQALRPGLVVLLGSYERRGVFVQVARAEQQGGGCRGCQQVFFQETV